MSQKIVKAEQARIVIAIFVRLKEVAPDKISKEEIIFSLFVVAETSVQVSRARLPALNRGYLSDRPMCGISFGCQAMQLIHS